MSHTAAHYAKTVDYPLLWHLASRTVVLDQINNIVGLKNGSPSATNVVVVVYVLGLLLSDFQSTKALSFLNRSL